MDKIEKALHIHHSETEHQHNPAAQQPPQQQQAQQPAQQPTQQQPQQEQHHGAAVGKQLGNAAIFGAGASAGGAVVNNIIGAL